MKRGFLNDRKERSGFGSLRDPCSCRGAMIFSQQDRLGSWNDNVDWGDNGQNSKVQGTILKNKVTRPESYEPWIDMDLPKTSKQSQYSQLSDSSVDLTTQHTIASTKGLCDSTSGAELSLNVVNAAKSSSKSTSQLSLPKMKKSARIAILQPPRRGGPTLLPSNYSNDAAKAEPISIGKSTKNNPIFCQKFPKAQEKSNFVPDFGAKGNRTEIMPSLQVIPNKELNKRAKAACSFGSTIIPSQPTKKKDIEGKKVVVEGFGSDAAKPNLAGFGSLPANSSCSSARNKPFKSQPMLSNAPKAELLSWYSQKPRSVQITNECYITWNNGGMPHELRFTSVFVCPLSGELFLSGRYGDPESYDIDPVTNIVWYKSKKTAEHGAASRAFDCQSYRQHFCTSASNTNSAHLGSEKPYLEAKMADKHDHTSLPPPLPPLAPEIQEAIASVQKKFHDVQKVREWNKEVEKKQFQVSKSNKQQEAIMHQRYNDDYRRERGGAW